MLQISVTSFGVTYHTAVCRVSELHLIRDANPPECVVVVKKYTSRAAFEAGERPLEIEHYQLDYATFLGRIVAGENPDTVTDDMLKVTHFPRAEILQ